MALRDIAQNDGDDLFLLDIKDRNSHVSGKLRVIFPPCRDMNATMQDCDGLIAACVCTACATFQNSITNNAVDAFADDLFGLLLEHPFGTLVEERDHPAFVATHDRIARHVENGGEPGA